MGTDIIHAAAVVRTDRSLSASALADQDSAEWRDAFAALGLDITDPKIAAGAFAVGQILLWHLTEAAAGDGPVLLRVGKAITDAVVATAEFVR